MTPFDLFLYCLAVILAVFIGGVLYLAWVFLKLALQGFLSSNESH